MTKIMISVPSLKYSGTKGSGPVLPDGKHLVTIGAVALTDDSVSNPFSADEQPEKTRAYDDCYPVIAVKLTNPLGGLTERFHVYGFRKFSELSEAEKASGKFQQDLASGYALVEIIDPQTGKKIGIETGELKDGKPVKRAALGRVIDETKSATAQRILSDFLVACKVPANDEMSLEDAVEGIKKCVDRIGITVISEMYDGKRRARMTSPQLVTTAVATDAQAVEETRTDDDFA